MAETQGIANKVVLITGASSGIGQCTARLLAARGAKVVLAARRIDRLVKLVDELQAQGASATHYAVDVTQRGDLDAVVAHALSTFNRLDVLVNNAGVSMAANLEQRAMDDWDQMIDVNIKGVLYGIAAVLPHFRANRAGHVINVSSVAGQTVFPGATVYCATKFAVRAISEGLRQECKDIRVTNISPGATQSDLLDAIDVNAAPWVAEIRKIAIPAEAIARAIAFAIDEPHDVDVNEITVRPTLTQ